MKDPRERGAHTFSSHCGMPMPSNTMFLTTIIEVLLRRMLPRTASEQPAPNWMHGMMAAACLVIVAVAIGTCYLPESGSISEAAQVQAVAVTPDGTVSRWGRVHQSRWLTLTTHDGHAYSAIDDVIGSPDVGDDVTIRHPRATQAMQRTIGVPVDRLERADLPGLAWNNMWVSLIAISWLAVSVVHLRRPRVVGLGNIGRHTLVDD